MPAFISRNRNTNESAEVTSHALDAVTAVTIAPANPDRIYFSVSLGTTIADEFIAVRLYAASVDNAYQGIVLTRATTGNTNLFNDIWEMPADNIYTGEISAITTSGTATVYVTEY